MQPSSRQYIQKHGDLPPLWSEFPGVHPYSICWRMGAGEGYKDDWGEWWKESKFNEEQRIAYFKKWSPPHCWLEYLIWTIWDVDGCCDEGDELDTYFDRLEKLGFGSKADFIKDHENPKWLDEKPVCSDLIDEILRRNGHALDD